jgi:hypothetical protein
MEKYCPLDATLGIKGSSKKASTFVGAFFI